MGAELRGSGEAHRGKKFAIFIRPTNRAEKTGTLSVLKAFLSMRSHEHPWVASHPAPGAGVQERAETTGPGFPRREVWGNDAVLVFFRCSLQGNLIVMFFILSR